MARKPAPGPSLFGDAHMAPVARASVEPTRADALDAVKTVTPVSEPPPPVVVVEPPAPIVAPVVNEAPPRALHIVPPLAPIPEEDVIVEATEDGRFVVSLLRHYGTTAAAVVYTRPQLEMLARRIPPALGVG